MDYNEGDDMNYYNEENIDYNNEDDYNGDEYNNNEENLEEENIMDDNDIMLKTECEKLNNLVKEKDQKLTYCLNEYYKLKKQFKICQINSQNLQNELDSTKQKYFNCLKEIREKNKLINKFKAKMDANDSNLKEIIDESDINLLSSINTQLKNIEKDFFEEEENLIDNKKGENQNQELEKDYQVKLLMETINNFSKRLNKYKMVNMKEIVNLRNKLDSQDEEINTKKQFYSNIIDTIQKVKNCLPAENQQNFPNFSLNESDEKIQKNILDGIKIISDDIISNKNNTINMNINEELSKRLKEMSELLIKSNENLSKSRKDNLELKKKCNELESQCNNVNNKDALVEELSKKNQQIKSLEHVVSRLTNKAGDKEDAAASSDKGTNNLLFKDNKFEKDEIIEKKLQNYFDSYTNGEYEKNVKKTKNINNIKEELDKLSERINKELEKRND